MFQLAIILTGYSYTTWRTPRQSSLRLGVIWISGHEAQSRPDFLSCSCLHLLDYVCLVFHALLYTPSLNVTTDREGTKFPVTITTSPILILPPTLHEKEDLLYPLSLSPSLENSAITP